MESMSWKLGYKVLNRISICKTEKYYSWGVLNEIMKRKKSEHVEEMANSKQGLYK